MLNIDQIILLLLETVNMTQSIIIGLFLILINKKNKSSLLFLGLFLMSMSSSSILTIFDFFNTNFPNKQPYKLPINIFIIIPGFLLLYINKVKISSSSKFSNLVYIPIIIEILVSIILICFYQDNLQTITDSTFYEFYSTLLLLYFPFLISYILRQVIRHSKAINNQYSSTENRSLSWVVVLLCAILSYIFILIGLNAFFTLSFFEYIDTFFWLGVTIWTVYNGLKQQNTVNLITSSEIKMEESLNPSNDHNDSEKVSSKKESVENENESIKEITEEEIDESQIHQDTFNRIDRLITTKQLFLNKELTIADISSELEIHPRLASTSINVCYTQNFNRYINTYRVEYAKELLSSGRTANLNIEGIGNESGFKSNSSFYNSFKRAYNVTPLQFLKEQVV